MCNVPPVGLACIFSFREIGERFLDCLFYTVAFLVVWFLLKPLSWAEVVFIWVMLAAYLILECGGPAYVFSQNWKAFLRWLNKPAVCNNCQGTEFRIPDWWKEEIAGIPLSLAESESFVRLQNPPPQECTRCKELKI